MRPGDDNDGGSTPSQHHAPSSSSARHLDAADGAVDAIANASRETRLRTTDRASATASESVRVASRSPHPYHRRSSVLEGGTSRIKPDIAARSREEPLSGAATGARKGRKNTSGGEDENEVGRRDSETPAVVGRESPIESGTEADDESISYIKALPAPPLRLHKGLKTAMGTGLDGSETPLLTPSAIDEEGARFDFPITNAKNKRSAAEKAANEEELREARARFVKRRRAELGRRACEVLLLIVIGMLVLGNELVRSSIQPWHRGQFHEWNMSCAGRVTLTELCSRASEPCLHHLGAVPSLPHSPHRIRMETHKVMEARAEDHTSACSIRPRALALPTIHTSHDRAGLAAYLPKGATAESCSRTLIGARRTFPLRQLGHRTIALAHRNDPADCLRAHRLPAQDLCDQAIHAEDGVVGASGA